MVADGRRMNTRAESHGDLRHAQAVGLTQAESGRESLAAHGRSRRDLDLPRVRRAGRMIEVVDADRRHLDAIAGVDVCLTQGVRSGSAWTPVIARHDSCQTAFTLGVLPGRCAARLAAGDLRACGLTVPRRVELAASGARGYRRELGWGAIARSALEQPSGRCFPADQNVAADWYMRRSSAVASAMGAARSRSPRHRCSSSAGGSPFRQADDREIIRHDISSRANTFW